MVSFQPSLFPAISRFAPAFVVGASPVLETRFGVQSAQPPENGSSAKNGAVTHGRLATGIFFETIVPLWLAFGSLSFPCASILTIPLAFVSGAVGRRIVNNTPVAKGSSAEKLLEARRFDYFKALQDPQGLNQGIHHVNNVLESVLVLDKFNGLRKLQGFLARFLGEGTIPPIEKWRLSPNGKAARWIQRYIRFNSGRSINLLRGRMMLGVSEAGASGSVMQAGAAVTGNMFLRGVYQISETIGHWLMRLGKTAGVLGKPLVLLGSFLSDPWKWMMLFDFSRFFIFHRNDEDKVENTVGKTSLKTEGTEKKGKK